MESRSERSEGHEDVDMKQDDFEVAAKIFLERLNEDRMNRDSIQAQNVDQRFSTKYLEVKQYLLTSSYFSRILNVRSRKGYKKIVEDILYHNIQHSNTADLTRQRLYEVEALEVFNNLYKKVSIDTCGIFIDEEYSFL